MSSVKVNKLVFDPFMLSEAIAERKYHISNNYVDLYNGIIKALEAKKFPKFKREIITSVGLGIWTCFNIGNGDIIGFISDDTCVGSLVSHAGVIDTSTVLNISDLSYIKDVTGFDLVSIVSY